MKRLLLIVALAGCAAEAPVDPPAAEHLPLPDLSDVDWEASFAEGFLAMRSMRTEQVWTAHANALVDREAGCPDLWASPPPGVELDDDASLGWADLCRGSVDWTGFLFWDGALEASGELDAPEGRTVVGDRVLVGDGRVAEIDGPARFAFAGRAEDAFTLTEGPSGASFSRSSLVVGEAVADQSWRAELYQFVTWSSAGTTFELRGEAWLPDDLVTGRFDSIAADLTWGDADPDGCALEPRGWLGLRDPSAYWYELVFQPGSGGELPNEPLDACDGCGTLYARGLEQGTVCLDVAALLDVPAPAPADYLLTLRDLTTTED